MRKRTRIAIGWGALVVALAGLLAVSGEAVAGRGNGPIVYVMGQGLFYDSIVTADPLPPHGPFQQLMMGGPSPSGLKTMFGPGDTGYLGGRWWLDVDGNGEMDDTDHYFSCPLLGPGRTDP